MNPADMVGAFCAHGAMDLPGAGGGPLTGLRGAVKDLFDVAGVPTGAGSPAWLATHPVPTATAPAVSRLLQAGAHLVGKTQTDEIAWSLTGQNHHYGTPRNVAAPGRIPGGSSSGSAAATAAGLVDFALGSDTGGSVRLPASFCGLFGIRTTHGRIPLEGAVPLAPSYDTVGWFARDATVFAAVGAALLDGATARPVERVLLARDLFEAVDPRVRDALRPAVAMVEHAVGSAEPVELAPGGLDAWRDIFRLVQSSEAWAVHRAWVERVRPAFGPGVRERFAAAAALDPDAVATAREGRAAVAARLRALLPAGTVLLVPSAPGAAPLLDAPESELEALRAAALALLCPAGHAGLPQISLPLATLDGCPLGLGVIGTPGADEDLLQLAEQAGIRRAG